MRLKDKVAIVTGAASGFGEGIARRFAEEGASVLIADIAEAKGAEVAASIPRARFCAADVAKAPDVRAMVEAALEDFGGLDILVNNAGVSHRNQPMLEVDEATFDRVYAVNVKSLYLTARACVPILRQQGGGAILNIASTAAARPRPGLTWYNGTKGAAIKLTRSIAAELAPEGIRVNAINPVIGETGLTATFMGGDTPELRRKFVATIPLGRMSRPLDVANAALFLCSPEAEFLTGVCLDVDGGRSI
jgi:3-oxoacyl-[acyl-carrier protein] reductase